MPTDVENFIPTLFKILFGFVTLNIIVNLILLSTRKLRIYRTLAIFWPVVLVVFMVEGALQEGNLAVSLGYSTTIVSCSIFAMIGFEVIGRRFPWQQYILYYVPFFPAAYILNELGFGFTVVAMPFAIATATPLLHALFYILYVDRHKTTRLQKVLGGVYFLQAIHCFNFAFFRMDPGAQLWGWFVTYVIYDMMAILLPSIALEQFNLAENEKLQRLVSERTEELNQSLTTNNHLLKILIHDMSNPLMVMKSYLHMYREGRHDVNFLVDRIQKSQTALEDIIHQVKNIHRNKNFTSISLCPVNIEDCFNEISFILDQRLKQKGVSLKFTNLLSSDTYVLADQISLTHSVLSNLIGNGIKFTAVNSQIEVIAREENRNVIIEIKDQGPGIPKSVVENVMRNKESCSTVGTMGEKGSGLGLTIAKSFVDSYGGQIEFESSSLGSLQQHQGTSIRITLDRA